MSFNYANGLSPYEHKGKLGLEEKFDSKEVVAEKVALLANFIKSAKHVVVHTGAGISTSAGIPDFRGPNGVWTLEAKGLKPKQNIAFDDAVPTKTHMALTQLVKSGNIYLISVTGISHLESAYNSLKHQNIKDKNLNAIIVVDCYIHYIISQNIDGLHLRSGLHRNNVSELHGNMFVDRCKQCERQIVRSNATSLVGQKCTGISCPIGQTKGRPCRGKLHDTILDWEHDLPEDELLMADYHSSIADLSITLGTTLQIIPSGNLPLATKKIGGHLVICNLQPTKHDRKADLLIHTYVDEIMVQLMDLLELELPIYDLSSDPTKQVNNSKKSIEWTIEKSNVRKMRKIYDESRKKLVLSKRKQESKVFDEKKPKVEDETLLTQIVEVSKRKQESKTFDEKKPKVEDETLLGQIVEATEPLSV